MILVSTDATIPISVLGRYADYTFTLVMMAKVYCVQMTMMLGFDVLFQDVDVVWYKNPIQFFQDKSSKVRSVGGCKS